MSQSRDRSSTFFGALYFPEDYGCVPRKMQRPYRYYVIAKNGCVAVMSFPRLQLVDSFYGVSPTLAVGASLCCAQGGWLVYRSDKQVIREYHVPTFKLRRDIDVSIEASCYTVSFSICDSANYTYKTRKCRRKVINLLKSHHSVQYTNYK